VHRAILCTRGRISMSTSMSVSVFMSVSPFLISGHVGAAMEISREEEEIREIREGVVCAGGSA